MVDEQWDAFTVTKANDYTENAVWEADRHIARYNFAGEKIAANQWSVADAACGMGYGARVISTFTNHTGAYAGFDLSESAIDYANRKYGWYGSFTRGNIEHMDLQGYDCVVSFETIEHLVAPEVWLANLKPRHLFGSVPITPTMHDNPYHLHDFTKDGFKDLLKETGWDVQYEWMQSDGGGEKTYVFYAQRSMV